MPRRVRVPIVLVLLAFPLFGAPSITLEPSGAVLRGSRVHLEVTATGVPPEGVPATVLVDGAQVQQFTLVTGEQNVVLESVRLGAGEHAIEVRTAEATAVTTVAPVPGWLSLVPPAIAIVLALVFHDVLIALFAGIFSGALIAFGWNPVTAFARSIDRFIAGALANGDHAKIIIFSLLLGGMVGAISRSGGTQGIVDRLRGFATSARRGQLAAWMMGVVIFFDDYANTLIVGSTMRPITDRLRISREKLAYIVDSTAAPVASLVPISTWIGFEDGLIAAAFQQIGFERNPYLAFVDSIPFRFYPILALVLGFTIAIACRDFGPMLRAERRASETGEVIAAGDTPLADFTAPALTPSEGTRPRAVNAILPILTVVVLTVAGMWVSGSAAVERSAFPSTGAWVREVFGNAASLDALLWASLSAVVVAALLPILQRTLSVKQTMEAVVEGFKGMLLALIVLVLAWGIGDITGVLHTADYVVGLAEGVLRPEFLPVLVFVASAVIAFATGTSWGTMAILMPLVIPIAHRLSVTAGHAQTGEMYYLFMIGTISSVLAGSVWGDHCSPISDTTILSSMGSGSDHIAHVRTQLPYAIGVGVLAMLVGDIPTAFGLSPWISILAGSAVLVAAVLLFGKRSDWRPTDTATAAE